VGVIAFFQRGGVFMWPLLACALIGIAYVIERFVSLGMARVNARAFVNSLKSNLKQKGIDGGLEYCHRNRSPLARVMEKGLESYKKVGPQKDTIEEAISNAGNTELTFLERGLPILAAVSTIAPIIGFLGTVSGMISAFDAIAIAGEIEPTLVASGISEALITTATGLTIAFPVVAFHVYFTTRASAYTRMMETSATNVIEFLMEEKP
jgi:biopolymer transport protein ExbB